MAARELCRGEDTLYFAGRRFEGQKLLESWSRGHREWLEEWTRAFDNLLHAAVRAGGWIVLWV